MSDISSLKKVFTNSIRRKHFLYYYEVCIVKSRNIDRETYSCSHAVPKHRPTHRWLWCLPVITAVGQLNLQKPPPSSHKVTDRWAVAQTSVSQPIAGLPLLMWKSSVPLLQEITVWLSFHRRQTAVKNNANGQQGITLQEKQSARTSLAANNCAWVCGCVFIFSAFNNFWSMGGVYSGSYDLTKCSLWSDPIFLWGI